MIRRILISIIAALFLFIAAIDLAERNWRVGAASALLGIVNYLLIA